jgi:hypothetical protein
VPQGMDTRIGKAQTRSALAIERDGIVDVLEAILGEDAVMTEALDVKQAAAGGKADLAQLGEVDQELADAEVVGVGASALAQSLPAPSTGNSKQLILSCCWSAPTFSLRTTSTTSNSSGRWNDTNPGGRR